MLLKKVLLFYTGLSNNFSVAEFNDDGSIKSYRTSRGADTLFPFNRGIQGKSTGAKNSLSTVTIDKNYAECLIFVSFAAVASTSTLTTNDSAATLELISSTKDWNGQNIIGLAYKAKNLHKGKTITISNYYSGGLLFIE